MYEWPIVKELANIFGRIVNELYNFIGLFGTQNVFVCVVALAIIMKICFFPVSYFQVRNKFLATKTNPDIKRLNAKYNDANKKDAGIIAKINMEKALITRKYGFKNMPGCLLLFIQFPIIFGLYAVLYDMAKFVPSLPADPSIAYSISLFSVTFNLQEIPGFAFSLNLILPFITAAVMFLSKVCDKLTSPSAEKKIKWTDAAYPLMMLFFCLRTPLFVSVYWGLQSIIGTLINVLLTVYFKKRTERAYIESSLRNLNRSRNRRQLPLVGGFPTIQNYDIKECV